jgi:UDP-2,3-diacylglucosamine hydrolase
MNDEILFVSDLHLAWDKPEITERFLRFLAGRAKSAQALYILGDLFDAWVGDDDFSPPARQVRRALAELTQSGVQVFFQPGNRDFLLGGQFSRDTGVELLGDYHVAEIGGKPTLLMHGDLLCTDDLPYQAFRIKSRSMTWQQNVLAKPLWLRLLAGRWYRLRSYFHKRKKSLEIMDVNHGAVEATMRLHGCKRLIHGHTHRPHVHQLMVDGEPAERFVLAAWTRQDGQCLSWTPQGYCMEAV